MMFSRVSLFLAASLASITVLAAPSPADLDARPLVSEDVESPIPGYSIGVPMWSIEVSPGNYAQLNGTVEQVVHQATQLNPNFAAMLEANQAMDSADGDDLNPNGATVAHAQGNLVCGVYPSAHISQLNPRIQYLRDLGIGWIQFPAGPKTCSRVSCAYNTGIFVCNDNPHEIRLDYGWDMVVNSAQHIVNSCQFMHPERPDDATARPYLAASGQNFEDGGWNVIARGWENYNAC